MASKFIKYLLPIFIFSFVLLTYLHNLSRSVYGGDVGDLVTAAKVMGVAHPPGYPLFTLLGFLLTRINFISPAFMVGLISAFSSALAVLIYYFLSLKFTKNKFIAFVSSFVLAFNYLFWFYAEIAEVFALNNLFVVLLMFLGFMYYKYKNEKFLYALSFFVGLSFTNHHTIVLVYPSILILVLSNYEKIFKNQKLVIKNILFLLTGLLVYLYVPIAASYSPVVNWDRVTDLKSFLRLLLRQDYGTFNAGIFASTTFIQRIIILKTYFSDVILQLTLPVVLLNVLGAFYLFLKDKRLFVSILLAFLISGPLFIGYAGFPLLGSFFIGIYERFFVMSVVLLMMFFPFGLLFFVEIINKIFRKKSFQNLFIGIFLIIPITFFYYNFPKTDLHRVTVGDDLAYDLISPLPKNSILFLSGDTMLFNAWYVNYALNFRPDVRIINLNGLAGDVYFERKINDYKKAHPKEKNDKDLPIKVIKELFKAYPIFSYDAVQPSKGEKLIWIPYGLTSKLVASKKDIKSKHDFTKENLLIWNNFKFLNSKNKNNLALGNLTIAETPSIYANAMLSLGNFYFTNYQDKKGAYEFYLKAKNIDPFYHKTYEVLGIYFSDINDCKKTNENLQKAIGIYPFEKISYMVLYSNYKYCFKDTKKANETVVIYNKLFQSDFFKDAKIKTQDLKK